MKIAFCLFKYFPFGGLQRDFMRVARACVARGHEVHVFTMQWDGDIEPSFHLHLIKAKGWQNHTRIAQFVYQCHQQLDATFDRVVGFNKMPHLDVYYAADVCYLIRAQAKHHWFYRLLPRYRQLVAFEKSIFQPFSRTQVLLISPTQATEFKAAYQTENERLHLLPPSIERNTRSLSIMQTIRSRLRENEGIPPDHLVMLMVGSGFKTKGLDRALLALANLPDAQKKMTHFYVIGKDNPNPFIALATRLKVNAQVTFLGGRVDVPDWLAMADCLIHPAYHESAGMVLLEAVTHGLPVLTLSVCGYAHYVQTAKAGMVLASPFSQLQLNKALQTMLSSSAQRKIWQRNGLTFAMNAAIYNNTDHILQFIEKNQIPPIINDTLPLDTRFYLAPSIKSALLTSSPKISLFDQCMTLCGETYRHHKQRRTDLISLNGTPYFIKKHEGIGWKEIFKNFFQGRQPVYSAYNEWAALKRLHALGIPAPHVMGYGRCGMNPANIRSFIILEALTDTQSLEEVGATWATSPPTFKFKRALIKKVAQLTRALHVNGINHRDLYLCHFLLKQTKAPDFENPPLFLIDLHRAKIRKKTPTRWLIKDLAGLYFSSMEIGLTKHDLWYFIKHYREKNAKIIWQQEQLFWKKVKERGDRVYHQHQQ